LVYLKLSDISKNPAKSSNIGSDNNREEATENCRMQGGANTHIRKGGGYLKQRTHDVIKHIK